MLIMAFGHAGFFCIVRFAASVFANREVPALSRARHLTDLTPEQLFEKARSTKSDINEHYDKLRELAAQAESVVEFGMRHGVSTVATRQH